MVCAVCQCGAHDTLEMDMVLAVGFGETTVTRDGVSVYSENSVGDSGTYWYAKDAEDEAADDPDHDWRIRYYAPLYEATYQRHGPGHWVLVEKGPGFA